MDIVTLKRLIAVDVESPPAMEGLILNLAAAGLLPDTSKVDALVEKHECSRKFKNRMAKHAAMWGANT